MSGNTHLGEMFWERKCYPCGCKRKPLSPVANSKKAAEPGRQLIPTVKSWSSSLLNPEGEFLKGEVLPGNCKLAGEPGIWFYFCIALKLCCICFPTLSFVFVQFSKSCESRTWRCCRNLGNTELMSCCVPSTDSRICWRGGRVR